MELLGGFTFFAVCGGLAIPAVILGIKEKPMKYYGFAVTLIFVGLATGTNWKAGCYLVGYCILELIIARVYGRLRRRYGRNAGIYWTFLILSIAPLAIFKTSALYDLHIFGFLGISYMTFKTIQIVIEIYDGIIERINTFDFLYLLLFFPTVTSGPIDRSRRFNEDINRIISKEEYMDMLGNGLFQICLGMVYKFAIATGFFLIETNFGMKETFLSSVIYMYSYGFYLFFDFAGYSLMAMGISRIFGVNTPKNFDKPFISKDILDFWNRWHITLSQWFRDFVFSRIVMRAIKNNWFKDKLTRASVSFIINMTIMGVWHGLDIQYIIYGLYHGVLLAITEIYQKKSKFHKKHKKEKWYLVMSWFITFNLVMFGFFIFSGRFTYLLGL